MTGAIFRTSWAIFAAGLDGDDASVVSLGFEVNLVLFGTTGYVWQTFEEAEVVGWAASCNVDEENVWTL